MQDICKSGFDEVFQRALRAACAEAHTHVDEFAGLLSEHYASEDAVGRGYASAGRPYGHTVQGAARWYAERALALCLTSLASQHTSHHSNMAVVERVLACPGASPH